jgi:hypothetical protein
VSTTTENAPTPTCARCLRNLPLLDSDLMPRALYRYPRDETVEKRPKPAKHFSRQLEKLCTYSKRELARRAFRRVSDFVKRMACSARQLRR